MKQHSLQTTAIVCAAVSFVLIFLAIVLPIASLAAYKLYAADFALVSLCALTFVLLGKGALVFACLMIGLSVITLVSGVPSESLIVCCVLGVLPGVSLFLRRQRIFAVVLFAIVAVISIILLCGSIADCLYNSALIESGYGDVPSYVAQQFLTMANCEICMLITSIALMLSHLAIFFTLAVSDGPVAHQPAAMKAPAPKQVPQVSEPDPDGWMCLCGRANGQYAYTCQCGRHKADVLAGTANIPEEASGSSLPEDCLDDMSFIQTIAHSSCAPWHQYDVTLSARPCDWKTVIEWADHMAQADLKEISQVTACSLTASQETDITTSYDLNGCLCAKTPELSIERNFLSLAGSSQALRAPLKIVWFNRTKRLRLFTTLSDDDLMERYIETAIRRSFHTPNAMKKARPFVQSEL